jgi:peptidoglycan biosynthesis protein MviN/MurJ (putative lipid II flippase)
LSPWSGTFLFALTVPNLFRCLFGEGARTSAMIPIYADIFLKNPPEARRLLDVILIRLTLASLIAIGGFALCAAGSAGTNLVSRTFSMDYEIFS